MSPLLLLKAVHLMAAILWTGGMLVLALGLCCGRPAEPLITRLRAWDQAVTVPAMAVVWAAGIAIASLGGWFPDGWLLVKLVAVMVLSGLHGLLAGTLRRMLVDRAHLPPGLVRHAAPAVAGCIAVIVLMAVLKPL